MADARFFHLAGPFTLGQLAELTGSELSDPVAANKNVSDVGGLADADGARISFLDNKKYLAAFKATKAGACFVRPELAAHAPSGTVCLTHKNPYKAYALAAQAFYPAPVAAEYRAPSAVIDPAAIIGIGCHIGPGAVIAAGAKIGDNTRIGANAVIEKNVEIGAQSDIAPNVYITHAIIGAKVKIHPGACIGRPGFGFAMEPSGFTAVPQLGRVIIGDDVEIGANTTIDRGAGPDTVIGRGSRIDNLVQIGHNVKIGKFCVIVSQTGIAGSTELGDYVVTGGQAGLNGHIKIASGTKIAAQAGIMQSIEAPGDYMGSPAVPLKQFLRQTVAISKLVVRKGSEER